MKKKHYNKPSRYDIARRIALSESGLSFNNLLKEAGYTKQDSYLVEEILSELLSYGIIFFQRKRYTLAHTPPIYSGTLTFTRSGASFCSHTQKDDIFIPLEARFGAKEHDVIDVLLIDPPTHDKKAQGCVLAIRSSTKHHHLAKAVQKTSLTEFIFESLQLQNPLRFCASFSSEKDIPYDIFRCLYIIEQQQEIRPHLWQGTIIQCLGREKNVSTQEKRVRITYKLPQSFPSEVLTQAESFGSDVDSSQYPQRTDLQHIPFVTIDGEDSRDFDDAIFVTKQDNNYILYVAIADVTAYVEEGSPLDREAMRRANSYYFPSSVIPMLPESLSNGLCSLNPACTRLAMIAEMHFSAKGILQKHHVYEGIIKSHARLTYTSVQSYFDALDKGISYTDVDQDGISLLTPLIQSMLVEARRLGKLLTKNRKERGALFFSSSTPYFTIINDTVTAIAPYPHYESHRLIEEFMLVVNETIASLLTEHTYPVVYRVHAEPSEDKIRALRTYARYLFPQQHIPPLEDPECLQRLLNIAEGTPQESIFHSVAIRSMMQARYSLEHAGHYGLQSHTYCHFTSPIRRYSDCLVHRILKYYFHKKTVSQATYTNMVNAIDTLNTNERLAIHAERDVHTYLSAIYMKQYIGTTCEAIITGVSHHALHIAFPAYSTTGTILLSYLHDDYYEVIEHQHRVLGQRTKKSYALGDIIEVTIDKISLEHGDVLCLPVQARKKRKVPVLSKKKIKHKKKKGSVKKKKRVATP